MNLKEIESILIKTIKGKVKHNAIEINYDTRLKDIGVYSLERVEIILEIEKNLI